MNNSMQRIVHQKKNCFKERKCTNQQLHDRNQKGQSLSRSRLGRTHHIAASQTFGNRLGLNLGHFFKAQLLQRTLSPEINNNKRYLYYNNACNLNEIKRKFLRVAYRQIDEILITKNCFRFIATATANIILRRYIY